MNGMSRRELLEEWKKNKKTKTKCNNKENRKPNMFQNSKYKSYSSTSCTKSSNAEQAVISGKKPIQTQELKDTLYIHPTQEKLNPSERHLKEATFDMRERNHVRNENSLSVSTISNVDDSHASDLGISIPSPSQENNNDSFSRKVKKDNSYHNLNNRQNISINQQANYLLHKQYTPTRDKEHNYSAHSKCSNVDRTRILQDLSHSDLSVSQNSSKQFIEKNNNISLLIKRVDDLQDQLRYAHMERDAWKQRYYDLLHQHNHKA
jgi:hypothetical protein